MQNQPEEESLEERLEDEKGLELPFSKSELAKDWIEKGRKVKSLKRKEACYSIAVEIDPESIPGIINLAAVRIERSNYDEAIKLLKDFLKSDSDDIHALSNACCSIALALYKKGEVDESVKYYHKAIQFDPFNAMAYNNLGDHYFKIGEDHKAMEYFAEAIRANMTTLEKVSNENAAIPFINLGTYNYKYGIFDKAFNCFEKARELAPNSPEPYFRLGRWYYTNDRLDEAKKHFEKAAELDTEGKLKEAAHNFIFEKLDLEGKTTYAEELRKVLRKFFVKNAD